MAAALMLLRPVMKLLGLLLRSSAALLLLKLLQQAGGFLGISLGVNLCNALILGLLGVPGFALLLMLQWLLKT